MTWVRRVIAIGLFAGLLVAGWTLAARNQTAIDVDGFFYRAEGIQVWVALAGAFAAGSLVAAGALCLPLARGRLTRRRYRRELAALEAEVHQLRNLPLSADAGENQPGSER
ncbi:MAG: hypothetical protein VCC02_03895 [Myxococcota bacterium]|jgi:uncharacterized integral membrane protein